MILHIIVRCGRAHSEVLLEEFCRLTYTALRSDIMVSTVEMTKPADSLSFEQALAELESIVRDLETGNAPLEDAIARYERGMALKAHCERKLREAQAKIEKITVHHDGSVSASPFQE